MNPGDTQRAGYINNCCCGTRNEVARARLPFQIIETINESRGTREAQKANVTGYFLPEVKKQLRLLAAERETTIQNLLAEALNDLFAKNGKPEIASLEEKD